MQKTHLIACYKVYQLIFDNILMRFVLDIRVVLENFYSEKFLIQGLNAFQKFLGNLLFSGVIKKISKNFTK